MGSTVWDGDVAEIYDAIYADLAEHGRSGAASDLSGDNPAS
jgi:hypothetical protein